MLRTRSRSPQRRVLSTQNLQPRPALAPDRAARQIGTMTTRKFVVPALIDPPGPYAPLAEWLDYRDELQDMDLPGLAPFIREADANIARATPPDK
jgi:hypothetical protein